MSPNNEGQQSIIETTGVEKPTVPQTSEDYQAMAEPAPESNDRWYPTEGEPTLDVPVVRVDGTQSDSESATSDAANVSEQEVPTHPGEFDKSTVKPVVRDGAGTSERNKPGKFIRGLAVGAAVVSLGAGITGAAMGGTGDTEVNATRGDKTEQEENADKYSGIITPGAEIGGTDVSAEAAPQPETQPIEATPETEGASQDTAENIEFSPTTTAPYTGENAPVIDNETVFPANPESSENTTEVEKAAQSVVMLADFFMGNEPLTGLSPTIQMGEDNSGTLTYSGEGFSVSITGEMTEPGVLNQNPLDSLRGFHNITISDEGKTVSTMMDADTGIPALQLIIEGSAFTTNNSIYPRAQLNEALVAGNVPQVANGIKDKATKK
jgi:hypothetical protein